MKKILYIIAVFLFSLKVSAATALEIDTRVNSTLKNFYSKTPEAQDLVNKAKGALVFPSVFKAGVFFLGGEYGEGALRINDETVDYYSTAAGAFGFQLGAQKKSIIILFLEESALTKFRNSPNWEVGVDASIAVIDIGTAGSLDSTKFNRPIIAFVLDQKGLMYNLTLEGSKFTKLKK
jgi:lipid-binding SYLF domain-containing protein